MNKPYTFVFLGRSGAGKGTQSKLLREYIEKKYQGAPIVSFDMGGTFREFFKREELMPTIGRKLTMDEGKFQPDFITNALFINKMAQSVAADSIIFIDGVPRSIGQLEVFKDLMNYIGRVNPIFINVEISTESAKKRMIARGRGDDSEEKIDSRFNEYNRTVVPMIEAIKNDSFFNYLELDGEPDAETINKNLLNILAL